MTTLIVIGANAAVAKAAETLPAPVVHVLRPGFTGLPGSRVLNCDYLNHDDFAPFVDEALRPLNPIAVISLTELGLEPAAFANERLGIPGVPLAVVRDTRNKYRMRMRLQQRAPHLNPGFTLADDPDALAALAAVGRPLIAKPVDGVGSTGILLLLEEDELPAAARTSSTLVEQYIGGVEYSVESISRAGRHTIVGIAQTGSTTGFVESSHLMPPVGLAETDREKIALAVKEMLDALELADGAAHTEIKVDETGRVLVIETHNRLGGDGIADLVRITTGINWRRASLGWPLGVGLGHAPATAGAAATVFFVAEPGRVCAVAEPPALESVTIESWQVTVAAGDVIGPLHSSAARLGVAMISATDPVACHAAVHQLSAMQVVRTTATAVASPKMLDRLR